METVQPKRARLFTAIAGTRRIVHRHVEKLKALQAEAGLQTSKVI